MKYYIILFIFSIGCTTKRYIPTNVSNTLKDDINKSIVEDFYGNDTINKKIYLMK